MTKPKEEQKEEQKTFSDVYALLSFIQREMKAPKGRYNDFGKYWSRSCEDVIEALKPLLPEGAYITLQDDIMNVGARFYVQATASLVYRGAFVQTTAFAREPDIRKGFDESQITGSSSSYARKYALGGLFAIDDEKDADTQEPPKEEPKAKPSAKPQSKPSGLTDELRKRAEEIRSALKDAKTVMMIDRVWNLQTPTLDKIRDADEASYAWLDKYYLTVRDTLVSIQSLNDEIPDFPPHEAPVG